MNIRLLRNTAAQPDNKSQSETNISQLTEPNYIDNNCYRTGTKELQTDNNIVTEKYRNYIERGLSTL